MIQTWWTIVFIVVTKINSGKILAIMDESFINNLLLLITPPNGIHLFLKEESMKTCSLWSS